MRKRHPEWSQRQLECCLYWQGTARKQLRDEIERFLNFEGHHYAPIMVPEAAGVNVTETMRLAGIELEWPPRQYAYQVALAGIPCSPRLHQPDLF